MGKLYGLSHLGLLSGVVVTLHHMGGGFWAFVGGYFLIRSETIEPHSCCQPSRRLSQSFACYSSERKDTARNDRLTLQRLIPTCNQAGLEESIPEANITEPLQPDLGEGSVPVRVVCTV